MHFKNILVTTDLSENSLPAFEVAAYQAKMENSRITLMHIVAPYELPPELRRVIWSAGSISQMEKDYLEGCKNELENLAKEHFHEQEVEIISKLSTEPPAKAICEFAKNQDSNLIVMTSQGHGALGTLFLGSVTQKVIAHAPCPVMVIPVK